MLRFPDQQGAKRPLCAPFLAGCLLVWSTFSLQAQHWSEGALPQGDWSSAFNAFDATWTDSLPQKGKGFKPFMRWRHFATARFAFDGASPFKSAAPWEATQWERMGRAARDSEPEAVWRQAIPTGSPLVGGAGRVNRVVVSAQDTAEWYACAPSGGLWRSEDSGQHWNLLGTQDWAGMGVSDVALHPADSLSILAATGDSDFGSAYGIGLMSTSDMGATWQTTGLTFALSESATCSRVHRKVGAPHHILVATSDGIWLSEDNGETFSLTYSGICSDLIPHPGDSAVWHAALRPGELLRSTDGGRHWNAVQGLPSTFSVSRYTLAASASNPQVLAAIAAKSGSQGLQGFYVSQDSGQTYTEVPDLPNLLGWTYAGADFGGQGFYDLALAIDPVDEHHIIAGGVNIWESHDGGDTWACIGHWFGEQDADFVHADHHALSFVPGSNHWVSAHDGGVSRKRENGFETLTEGLNVGQVYNLGFANSRPDRLISGWQDNGINLLADDIHAQVIGADGFHCLIDPNEPDTLVAAEYFGKAHLSLDGGWTWDLWLGSNGEGVNERGDWNTPMAYAPSNPDRIFIAKHRLYWTDNQGETWEQTSALSGAEMEVLALAPSDDSTAVVARGAFAFATQNLEHWTPLSGLPGLPILDVVFDHADADVFWMSFGGYEEGQRVWKTSDAGLTWTDAGEGLPDLPVNTLARHPESGDLYAGTDAGVYALNSGSDLWTPYKTGLPEVLCSDLGVRSSTGELLLATYGSGIWRAPLFTPPARDAALTGIHGHQATQCAGPLHVTATARNAGSDTLAAMTLLWNGIDTVQYGMLLAPNQEASLPWPNVNRGTVGHKNELVVRILEVVGLHGGLAAGELTSGVDAISENDALGVTWEHRVGTGPVVVTTTADCHPMETAWALSDSTGVSWHRRQHFVPEAPTVDTVCLTHGCYEVILVDRGSNGFTSTNCGMEGDLVVASMGGVGIWSVTDTSAAGIGFSSGVGGSFCLPLPAVAGCTDSTACNFDPSASISNDMCDFTCWESQCPEDLDGDGFFGATDILAVLSEFGCSSECTVDITGDGAVSANDILALLALYGQGCEE